MTTPTASADIATTPPTASISRPPRTTRRRPAPRRPEPTGPRTRTPGTATRTPAGEIVPHAPTTNAERRQWDRLHFRTALSRRSQRSRRRAGTASRAAKNPPDPLDGAAPTRPAASRRLHRHRRRGGPQRPQTRGSPGAVDHSRDVRGAGPPRGPGPASAGDRARSRQAPGALRPHPDHAVGQLRGRLRRGRCGRHCRGPHQGRRSGLGGRWRPGIHRSGGHERADDLLGALGGWHDHLDDVGIPPERAGRCGGLRLVGRAVGGGPCGLLLGRRSALRQPGAAARRQEEAEALSTATGVMDRHGLSRSREST